MALGSVPDSKVYDPPGFCIYCGATQTTKGGKLTREHIIPFGLSGRLIFRHASCDTCADQTKKFEQACLKKMFFQTRTYLDMPSYRSTKDRPRSFKMGKPPSDQSDYDGDRGPPDWSKYKWDDVPLENYPLMILFPTFDLPSIVLGTAPSNVIKIREAVLTIPRLQNVEVGTIDKGTTFAPVEIPIADFLRMLAKIAHGVAVAELGAASFTPLLNDIILGRSNFLGHYVGSPWFGKVRRNSNTLHRIYLEVRNGWLVAFVQLFAKYHAPCYCVVVGKPSASLLRWRLDGSSSAKFTDDAFDTRAVKFAVKIV